MLGALAPWQSGEVERDHVLLELQRLLEGVLLPPGGFLVWILLASLRPGRLARASIALAALGLWALSTPAVSGRLLDAAQAATPHRSIAETPQADAILVLGGGLRTASVAARDDLGGAADRMLHAARLHRAGRAPLVLLSGGPPTARSEAEAMAALLEEWGVPREAMRLESRSRTTRENCRFSAEIAAREGLRTLLLVTSALHMPRALEACRAEGLRVEPAATDFGALRGRGLGRLMPSAEALGVSREVIRERLSTWVYRWTDRAGGSSTRGGASDARPRAAEAGAPARDRGRSCSTPA